MKIEQEGKTLIVNPGGFVKVNDDFLELTIRSPDYNRVSVGESM